MKTGLFLLIVGILVVVEALVRGQGRISMETTVFALTIINLGYVLFHNTKEKNEKTFVEESVEVNPILDREDEVVEVIQTTFSEEEERDFDFVHLIHKYSNIRIESLLENTKDMYKKRELLRVLEKRRGLI